MKKILFCAIFASGVPLAAKNPLRRSNIKKTVSLMRTVAQESGAFTSTAIPAFLLGHTTLCSKDKTIPLITTTCSISILTWLKTNNLTNTANMLPLTILTAILSQTSLERNSQEFIKETPKNNFFLHGTIATASTLATQQFYKKKMHANSAGSATLALYNAYFFLYYLTIYCHENDPNKQYKMMKNASKEKFSNLFSR